MKLYLQRFLTFGTTLGTLLAAMLAALFMMKQLRCNFMFSRICQSVQALIWEMVAFLASVLELLHVLVYRHLCKITVGSL
jgi:hypothetical protein